MAVSGLFEKISLGDSAAPGEFAGMSLLFLRRVIVLN